MACKAGRLSLKDKEEVGAAIKVAMAVKSWITLYVKDIQNSNLDDACVPTTQWVSSDLLPKFSLITVRFSSLRLLSLGWIDYLHES